MARLSVWFLLILSGGFASGCKNSEPPNPLTAVVATAHGDELTLGEINAEMPAPLTGMDSASWCQRFIADWQQRRTLVHLAKTELPESERDFHREITQYTEALFIHAYEDRYLRDNLDTALSTSELQSFLDEQPELFKLNAPVFRARWLVFPANEPFPRDIRDWQRQLASSDAEVLSNLSSRCTDASMDHDLEAQQWWSWAELSERLPLDPRRASRQQASNRVTKIEWKTDTAAGRADDERALLLVTERLRTGQVSPVERVADRIGELLLHRRRNRTLVTMREQAVEAAWAEEALTIDPQTERFSDTP